MEKKLTYNEAYTRLQILDDIRALNLSAKAMAETLLMRVAAQKAIQEFAADREAILAADEADEEAKTAALEAKANEPSGTIDRRYSEEAFEQLCGAALNAGVITSSLATDEDGHPKAIPAPAWLEFITPLLALV